MKFMMLMIPGIYYGNKKVDADFKPDRAAMERMGKFNEELGKAVKITDLNGLHPLSAGARVTFKNGKPTVTAGPDIKAGEVLGGYWMIEAKSQEEVLQWAQRCPAEEGDIIEIRQIFEFPEDEKK